MATYPDTYQNIIHYDTSTSMNVVLLRGDKVLEILNAPNANLTLNSKTNAIKNNFYLAYVDKTQIPDISNNIQASLTGSLKANTMYLLIKLGNVNIIRGGGPKRKICIKNLENTTCKNASQTESNAPNPKIRRTNVENPQIPKPIDIIVIPDITFMDKHISETIAIMNTIQQYRLNDLKLLKEDNVNENPIRTTIKKIIKNKLLDISFTYNKELDDNGNITKFIIDFDQDTHMVGIQESILDELNTTVSTLQSGKTSTSHSSIMSISNIELNTQNVIVEKFITMSNFIKNIYTPKQIKYFCILKKNEQNIDLSGIFSNMQDIIGTMTLVPFKEHGFIEIYDLYIGENYQGNGYGTHMLSVAKELMKANNKNYNTIWLGVDFNNPNYKSVVNFYLRNGFVIMGRADTTMGGADLSKIGFGQNFQVLAMTYSTMVHSLDEINSDDKFTEDFIDQQVEYAVTLKNEYFEILGNSKPLQSNGSQSVNQGQVNALSQRLNARQLSLKDNASSGNSQSQSQSQQSINSRRTRISINSIGNIRRVHKHISIKSDTLNRLKGIVLTNNNEYGGEQLLNTIDRSIHSFTAVEGQPLSVNIPTYGLINYHTHNLPTYEMLTSYLGWPSGADMGVCVANFKPQRVHLVFGVEGIYSIQLTYQFHNYLETILKTLNNADYNTHLFLIFNTINNHFVQYELMRNYNNDPAFMQAVNAAKLQKFEQAMMHINTLRRQELFGFFMNKANTVTFKEMFMGTHLDVISDFPLFHVKFHTYPNVEGTDLNLGYFWFLPNDYVSTLLSKDDPGNYNDTISIQLSSYESMVGQQSPPSSPIRTNSPLHNIGFSASQNTQGSAVGGSKKNKKTSKKVSTQKLNKSSKDTSYSKKPRSSSRSSK